MPQTATDDYGPDIGLLRRHYRTITKPVSGVTKYCVVIDPVAALCVARQLERDGDSSAAEMREAAIAALTETQHHHRG